MKIGSTAASLVLLMLTVLVWAVPASAQSPSGPPLKIILSRISKAMPSKIEGSLRTQQVRINPTVLANLTSVAERAGVEGNVKSNQTLRLNLFEHGRSQGEFLATVDFASQESKDTAVLRGTLNNIKEGIFSVVIHKGLVGIRVFSPAGNYSLHPGLRRGYIVSQENPNAAFPCKVLPGEKHPKESTTSRELRAENGSLIEVLVVYTTAAKDYYNGNVPNLERAVREMEEFTNLALRKSLPDLQPPPQVKYLAIEEVPNSVGDDLEDYAFGASGAPIRQKRDYYHADLVLLVHGTSNMVWAGQAFPMCDLESPNYYSQRGYAHVRVDYLERIKTMAHETGHLFGDQHDPAAVDSCSLYGDSRGHFFDARDEQGVPHSYGTILSYANAFNRIPSYSNPEVTYLGVPTGILNQRNNARAMRDSRIQLSNYRQSSGPSPQPIGQPPAIADINPADGVQLPTHSQIVISASITDDEAVTTAELYWQFSGRYLACPGGNGVDWSCAVSGSIYTWKLDVGSGIRDYQIRASDAPGNVVNSALRRINLISR